MTPFLTEAENTKTTEIILSLICRNMEAGNSFEKAKEQAFNRLQKEQPEILTAWISDNLKEV